jgi:hypothetical protein
VERIAPAILALQLDQVEGVQEDASVMPAMPQQVEARQAVVSARDRFPVDGTGARAQPPHGLDDQRKTMREIIARPAARKAQSGRF